MIIFGASLPASPQHIGCIDPACDVAEVIVEAYDSARFICDGLIIPARFLFYLFSFRKKCKISFRKDSKLFIKLNILLLIRSKLMYFLRCYCDSPKLQFSSYNSITPGNPIAIAAIPSHLYHIMFELFKVPIDFFNFSFNCRF